MGNPRTIKGAHKRGWKVLYIPRNDERSWIGTLNWIARNCPGKNISEYKWQGDGIIAFEDPAGATTATLFLDARPYTMPADLFKKVREFDNKSKV